MIQARKRPPGNMWNGSQTHLYYNTQIQEKCTDGAVSATGQSQRGSLIGSKRSLPFPARACGNVPEGKHLARCRSNGSVFCGTCSDGPITVHRSFTQEMHVVWHTCAYGEKRRTAGVDTRNLSECCPVSEPIKSPPLFEGRRSFIVDTLPRCIKQCGHVQRFNPLQFLGECRLSIGIQNAVPGSSNFWTGILQGLLMELNPYPVPVKRATAAI